LDKYSVLIHDARTHEYKIRVGFFEDYLKLEKYNKKSANFRLPSRRRLELRSSESLLSE
jgi:hypothetical protein